MTFAWVTKLRRYGSSESVIGFHLSQADAEAQASERNIDMQTDTYYAEQYDNRKASWA